MRGKAQRDGCPAVRWWMETFTRDMGKVRMWYLIQANAAETAVQARGNPRSPGQIISEIISVLPSPVEQLTDEWD